MSLCQLWIESPDQLKGKHVQQIIAFAGNGKLADESLSSAEFRDFLTTIPTEMLSGYAQDSLNTKFDNSGLALQDIVNQLGKRLGFQVQHGRYRGIRGAIGFDGIWKSNDNHSMLIEVKTTDAYRIDLNVIANYRRKLIQAATFTEEQSSIYGAQKN